MMNKKYWKIDKSDEKITNTQVYTMRELLHRKEHRLFKSYLKGNRKENVYISSFEINFFGKKP